MGLGYWIPHLTSPGQKTRQTSRVGCQAEGVPASARCGQSSRVRVGASPSLAPRLCGSEVRLSLFSVLHGRPGSCFFLLDAWADLAQEESYQVVAIVFHYLKVGDFKKKKKIFVLLFLRFGVLTRFLQRGFCVGLPHPSAEVLFP